MDKVREFQRRVAQCRELAVQLSTEKVRSHYQALADLWERLAADRLSHLRRKLHFGKSSEQLNRETNKGQVPRQGK